MYWARAFCSASLAMSSNCFYPYTQVRLYRDTLSLRAKDSVRSTVRALRYASRHIIRLLLRKSVLNIEKLVLSFGLS